MRLLPVMLGLVAGCDPVADKGITVSHSPIIAVGELGFVHVSDECTGRQSGCGMDAVLIDSISSDDPGVIVPLPLPEIASEAQLMAVGAGQTTVRVAAHNGINDDEYELPIEALAADAFMLEPVTLGVFRPTSIPGDFPRLITLGRSCAEPIRIQAESPAHFHFSLHAGSVQLLGSGYYPFTSTALEVAEPPFGAAHDEDVVAFQVGTAVGPAAITSPSIPGSQLAIEVLPRTAATSLALSDIRPIAHDSSGIWVEEVADGRPICIDNDLRVARSETPTVCSVSDARNATTQFRGPGPYRVSRSGSGTCRITFEVPALGLVATREY